MISLIHWNIIHDFVPPKLTYTGVNNWLIINAYRWWAFEEKCAPQSYPLKAVSATLVTDKSASKLMFRVKKNSCIYVRNTAQGHKELIYQINVEIPCNLITSNVSPSKLNGVKKTEINQYLFLQDGSKSPCDNKL